MLTIMKLVIASVLAVVALSSGSAVKPHPEDGTFELLILHNNDMHARFEQTSQMSGACTTADRDAGKCYGGFPRVAHVVKEARRAAQTGEGPPVLYLNAGDTYTGTAWFTLYKWKIAAEFINALQPDAVSMGNNDIDKAGLLSPFLENVNTEILNSNLIVKSTKKKIQKSVVFNIRGIKIGVVGYLTPEASMLDSISDIEYIDEILALKEEVKSLKSQNVNTIIALGYTNNNKNIEIAEEVDGLDVIITGNKNSFYWNGTTVSDFEKAEIFTQKSGKHIPIILSTAYDQYLGSLKIKLNAYGEIIDFNANPILLDSSVAQDVECLQIAEQYGAEFISKSEEVLGNTAVVLDGDSCNLEECNLGNLITDAIVYYYATRFEGENWTDAPVAIIHGSAVANSIAPTNRPAPITTSDIMSALPLESNVVVVTMTGTVLSEVLEQAVANYDQHNPTGQFLQFSGIRVSYDMSKDIGSRVTSAVVRCWSCFVPEFYPIDDWRTYKLLVPAALANGEFGYSMLVGLPRQDMEYDEVTCTADYIKLRSPVYPEIASRVVLNNLEVQPAPDSAAVLRTSLLSLTLIPILVLRF